MQGAESELVLPVARALQGAASKAEVLGQMQINTLLDVVYWKYHFPMPLSLKCVLSHTIDPNKSCKTTTIFLF